MATTHREVLDSGNTVDEPPADTPIASGMEVATQSEHKSNEQDPPRSPFHSRHSDSKIESTKLVAGQEQSPLFSIPAELRLQIYEFALSPSKQDHLGVHTRYDGPTSTFPPSVLSLLLTCRLVLSEAEPLFYSTNRLRLIMSPLPLPVKLSPRRLKAIQKLTLPLHKAAQQTLANLRLLRTHVPKVESLWLLELPDIPFHLSPWQGLSDQLVNAMEALPRLRDARVVNEHGVVTYQVGSKPVYAVFRRMCDAVNARAEKRKEDRILYASKKIN